MRHWLLCASVPKGTVLHRVFGTHRRINWMLLVVAPKRRMLKLTRVLGRLHASRT